MALQPVLSDPLSNRRALSNMHAVSVPRLARRVLVAPMHVAAMQQHQRAGLDGQRLHQANVPARLALRKAHLAVGRLDKGAHDPLVMRIVHHKQAPILDCRVLNGQPDAHCGERLRPQEGTANSHSGSWDNNVVKQTFQETKELSTTWCC